MASMRIFVAIAISLWMLAPAVHSQTSRYQGAIRILRSCSQPSRQDLPRSLPARCGSILLSRQVREPTFEARTAWHTHPLGQILIVTAGTGRVQRWGSVEEIPSGGRGLIPPGQKYWHGAVPNSSMAHIAIVEALDGKLSECGVDFRECEEWTSDRISAPKLYGADLQHPCQHPQARICVASIAGPLPWPQRPSDR